MIKDWSSEKINQLLHNFCKSNLNPKNPHRFNSRSADKYISSEHHIVVVPVMNIGVCHMPASWTTQTLRTISFHYNCYGSYVCL